MPYSVLLVEDDACIRERLSAAIAGQSELRLLAAVGTVAEGRAALSAQTPDALLVNLGLPDGDGGDLIPVALNAGARVTVLTVFSNGARLRAALDAGAHGCLFKDSSPRAICRTVTGLFTPAPASANHEFL
jgi:two-component system, NarL family, nitrate/nitrite response regulator NarL